MHLIMDYSDEMVIFIIKEIQHNYLKLLQGITRKMKERVELLFIATFRLKNIKILRRLISVFMEKILKNVEPF